MVQLANMETEKRLVSPRLIIDSNTVYFPNFDFNKSFIATSAIKLKVSIKVEDLIDQPTYFIICESDKYDLD